MSSNNTLVAVATRCDLTRLVFRCAQDAVADASAPQKTLAEVHTSCKVPNHEQLGASRELYNFPTNLRKNVFRNKLSPEEFLGVYGMAIPSSDHRRKPPKGLQITTPQPFDLSDPRIQCKFYKFYLKDLVRREEAEARLIQEHKFRAQKAPRHTNEPLFQQKCQADVEKKAKWADMSDFRRRAPDPTKGLRKGSCNGHQSTGPGQSGSVRFQSPEHALLLSARSIC